MSGSPQGSIHHWMAYTQQQTGLCLPAMYSLVYARDCATRGLLGANTSEVYTTVLSGLNTRSSYLIPPSDVRVYENIIHGWDNRGGGGL